MFPCSCRLSVCDRLPHWFKLPVWWESHVVVVTTAAAAFNSHFKNSHVFLDNVVMIIYLMILGLNNVLNNWPENFTSWFLSLIPVFLLQRKKKHMWLVFSFTQWPFCQKKGYFLFVFFFYEFKVPSTLFNVFVPFFCFRNPSSTLYLRSFSCFHL